MFQVTDNVLEVIDDLLNINEDLLIEANQDFNTSSKILSQLETLAQNQQLLSFGDSKVIEKSKLALAVIKPIPVKPVRFYAPRSESSNTHLTVNQDDSAATNRIHDASIYLPIEVISKVASDSIYSYVFRSDKLFLNGKIDANSVNASIVQSFILSASVGDQRISDLTEPVEMIFTKIITQNVTGETKCMFWDINKVGKESSPNYFQKQLF